MIIYRMSFDTNIENYNREELINMFELPTNFDKNIVEIKETKLRESVLNNNIIDEVTKKKIFEFLVQAKKIILDANVDIGLVKEVLSNVHNANYGMVESSLEDTQEHMIQTRPTKLYSSSYPGEYFPGQINPIKKRTLRTNLNIDTRFRENYYSTSASNFNINLPIIINNVLDLQLAAIELPASYYAVSKQYGNNYFGIYLTNTTGSIYQVITIPDGNYDASTIYTMINILLTNAASIDADFGNIVFATDLSNSTTGTSQTIVGFNGSQTVGAAFQLNFQGDLNGFEDKNTPLPLKFGWNLGFRNGIYINNDNYVSEGILDLSGPKYAYLVIDDHNNNVNNGFYNAAFNNSILNKNILARISLTAKAFNTLEKDNFNTITYPREYLGPVDIKILNIQLLDEYGRILYLNNMDYSFALKMTVVYDL
jgi:hypothetical protein